MKSITELAEWQALDKHCLTIKELHMRDWFLADKKRSSQFTKAVCGISIDYSRNRITTETLQHLINLANKCQLRERIHAIYQGAVVNVSENKSALHMQLRNSYPALPLFKADDIKTSIDNACSQMHAFAHMIQQSHITDIVNIGMGGSHVGPLMTTHALKHFSITNKRMHFISTPDDDSINELLSSISPETSLFIVASKSFSTIETLTNALTIKKWFIEKYDESRVAEHFIAVTANVEKAKAFGIVPERIFPLWEWVGGRYSIWSTIGLPLLIQVGKEHFDAFLQGANEMDQHLLNTEYEHNLPLLLALIGVWNNNFLGANAHAIIPYAYRLKYLIPYLQQLDMESNGKHIDQQGNVVSYKTGPVIFGQEGTEGQHTYHQWMHQSTTWVSADIILIDNPYEGKKPTIHHHLMKASALSQAEALMQGTMRDSTVKNESIAAKSSYLAGNRASNLIKLERLTPYHLGALIALYEHKIIAQGLLWGINSFDQWGVELGKQLLPAILENVINEHA